MMQSVTLSCQMDHDRAPVACPAHLSMAGCMTVSNVLPHPLGARPTLPMRRGSVRDLMQEQMGTPSDL